MGLSKKWIFICGIILVLLIGGLAIVTNQNKNVDNSNKEEIINVVNESTVQYEQVQLQPEKGYAGFEGWGTSLAWWGHAIGRWENEQLAEEIMDLVFDREKGLGLNILRYNIGGGENPEYNFLRPGGDVPGFWPEPDRWDWEADAYQRKILLGGIERGVNITEAFSNSPPHWMTISGSVTGAEDAGNNLKEEYYETFAHYLTEVVKHYRDHWNVEFRTLNPLNEPSANWWRKGNIQEGAHFDIDKQALMLRLTAESLKEKQLTGTVVSGPDDNSIDETLEALERYGDETIDILGQINVHTYNGSQMIELREYAAEHDIRLWMSEYGTGGTTEHDHQDMSSVWELADRIMIDLRALQPMAWVYWQAVENEGAKNNWGFIHANFEAGEETYEMTKQFYAMRQFTKFIEPGSYIASTSDGYAMYAHHEEKEQLTIVVRNQGSATRHLSIDLAPYKVEATEAQLYRTSESEDFVELPPLTLSEGSIALDIAPGSITTVVIQQAKRNE